MLENQIVYNINQISGSARYHTISHKLYTQKRNQ